MQAFWAGLTAGASALLINQRSWELHSFDAVVSSVRSELMYLLITSDLPSDFFRGTCESLAAIGLMLVLMCALWSPLLTINTEKEMIVIPRSCSFFHPCNLN